MNEEEKYKIALFMVIRNSKVLPAGQILNKTEYEINKMSYETMQELLKMIDFKRAKEKYEEGSKDLEQIEKEHKEENGRLREEITELEMDKQQQKFEINCLNSDIKNMYCEEAILSILEDEFDLSKNEAMNILENY